MSGNLSVLTSSAEMEADEIILRVSMSRLILCMCWLGERQRNLIIIEHSHKTQFGNIGCNCATKPIRC